MHANEAALEGAVNPPGATRMMIFAFLIFNLSLGCMFGGFGVLITAIEARLDVSREVSTLAIPVVTFGMSLLAPLFGGLANRISLRLLLMAASLAMAAGYAVLAVAQSAALFIGAYAVLIGPALGMAGAVGPSTLVTRWFRVHRGRALGIACTPALMAAVPMLVALVLPVHGLAAVYWLFAAIMLVCLAISALVVDHPPGAETEAAEAGDDEPAQPPGEATTGSLVSNSRFWRLAVAAGLYNAVIVFFSTSLVPFAAQLGIDPTRAAMLLTFYLVGTLVGTPLVGWGADRLGGTMMIAILSLLLGLWQGLLVTHPGFVGLAFLSGLAGLQGSAMTPSMGLALSHEFGASSFARAFGLCILVGLPFAVLSVPIGSAIFVRTGSYDGAFLLAAAALATALILAASMARRRAPAPIARA